MASQRAVVVTLQSATTNVTATGSISALLKTAGHSGSLIGLSSPTTFGPAPTTYVEQQGYPSGANTIFLCLKGRKHSRRRNGSTYANADDDALSQREKP
jgi:hypothetical protein